MSTSYEALQTDLQSQPKRWLVTGAAGFIGSHLVETLLKLNQEVVCFDNYSTGHQSNLDEVQNSLPGIDPSRLQIIDGDLADYEACLEATKGADLILHQGALGSVPRSIEDPITSHRSNTTGTLNLFTAAKEAGIKRIVYASSSSVYGDEPGLPKVEEKTGNLLSPYAATKAVAEEYANAFSRAYGMEFAGLRYFNVFGPRQDPNGPYAAVIPIWVKAMIKGDPVTIYGDGETSRDFTYVANVVQANLLAATTQNEDARNQVYNVAVGDRTTLNELYGHILEGLRKRDKKIPEQKPEYKDFRVGDVRHSLANVDKAKKLLGYEPTHTIDQGLELALDWYKKNV